jgi:hypothetical protein
MGRRNGVEGEEEMFADKRRRMEEGGVRRDSCRSISCGFVG